MNEPPATPPPPRIVVLRTTSDILNKTASIFCSNLLTFLLLSLFLFSLRNTVEIGTSFLASFIDNDPSIKPLVYRLCGPPNPTSPTSTITTRRRHRLHRCPFLQLTRIGILDDDFDHRFFNIRPKPQINSTSLILDSFNPQFGFSNFVSDNGIKASETVRSGTNITFRLIEIINTPENIIIINEINDNGIKAPFNETAESETDFRSFLKRFDLEHDDYTVLLFLVGAFYASYWLMVLAFIATYSKAHGIIFLTIVNDFCDRHNSFATTFRNGWVLGVKRLSSFIALRWVVRDSLTQLLAVWFFISIKNQYSLLKIYLRYKFMPFSIMFPWVEGFEREIHGFLVLWVVLDLAMSYVDCIAAWIVMAGSRKNWSDIVKEGYHLLSISIEPVLNLKVSESIVCGRYGRSVLTRYFGNLFALAFLSFMEVYLMVAWMVYYLSVKSMDANSSGQPFGQRELEAMLEDDDDT